jgi:hypothetical protein
MFRRFLQSSSIKPATLHEWSPINRNNSLELIIKQEPGGRLLWVYLEHDTKELVQGNYSLLGTPRYEHGIITSEHNKIIYAKIQEIGIYLQTIYSGQVRAWDHYLNFTILQKPKFPIEVTIPEEDILFAALEINKILDY